MVVGLIYLAVLVAVFVAVTVGVYSLLPSASQMYELRSRTAGRAEASAIQSPLLKLLWPALAALGPVVHRLGSERYRREKARELPLAGLPPVMHIDHLMALKVLLACALPILAMAFSDTLKNPIIALAIAGAGFVLPDRMVTEQRKAREKKIVKSLGPAIDMLTLAVEAGMDFLAGLQRVVDKGPGGPLREEITTIINDIRLGQTRGEALKAFAARINVPEVVTFVGVLVQAERLGTPIGTVLRSQADRMRTERFQRAEREGAKASQKLLLPLAVCIFPADMLVFIGPVALTFMYSSPF